MSLPACSRAAARGEVCSRAGEPAAALMSPESRASPLPTTSSISSSGCAFSLDLGKGVRTTACMEAADLGCRGVVMDTFFSIFLLAGVAPACAMLRKPGVLGAAVGRGVDHLTEEEPKPTWRWGLPAVLLAVLGVLAASAPQAGVDLTAGVCALARGEVAATLGSGSEATGSPSAAGSSSMVEAAAASSCSIMSASAAGSSVDAEGSAGSCTSSTATGSSCSCSSALMPCTGSSRPSMLISAGSGTSSSATLDTSRSAASSIARCISMSSAVGCSGSCWYPLSAWTSSS
mmetsp:Transcript_28235/g.71986  ORF Transcript_28235/g.71986 Transcript_28235/m.71986 type:complete len:289 (-) Transcript_28235:584-1450(-)